MNTASDEPIGRRRKVRKGTHSCWECRRRKVKCIFALPHDVTCIVCHRRGKKCVGQEVPDGSDISTKNGEYNEGFDGDDGFYDQPVGNTGENSPQELRRGVVSHVPSTSFPKYPSPTMISDPAPQVGSDIDVSRRLLICHDPAVQCDRQT